MGASVTQIASLIIMISGTSVNIMITNAIIIMVLTCNGRAHNGSSPTEHGEETERRGEFVQTKQVDQHDAGGGEHDQGEGGHNKG